MTKSLNECGVSCEESTSLCEFAELYQEALSHQVVTAVEIDKTLSIEGAAADAKAVGDKFTNCSLNFDDHIRDIVDEVINEALGGDY